MRPGSDIAPAHLHSASVRLLRFVALEHSVLGNCYFVLHQPPSSQLQADLVHLVRCWQPHCCPAEPAVPHFAVVRFCLALRLDSHSEWEAADCWHDSVRALALQQFAVVAVALVEVLAAHLVAVAFAPLALAAVVFLRRVVVAQVVAVVAQFVVAHKHRLAATVPAVAAGTQRQLVEQVQPAGSLAWPAVAVVAAAQAAGTQHQLVAQVQPAGSLVWPAVVVAAAAGTQHQLVAQEQPAGSLAWPAVAAVVAVAAAGTQHQLVAQMQPAVAAVVAAAAGSLPEQEHLHCCFLPLQVEPPGYPRILAGLQLQPHFGYFLQLADFAVLQLVGHLWYPRPENKSTPKGI